MGNKSYVMWNNKGGVGKSTITFHIVSVYAEKNPDRDVVVIDMCPQANSSSMLMGGGRFDFSVQRTALWKCEGEILLLTRL